MVHSQNLLSPGLVLQLQSLFTAGGCLIGKTNMTEFGASQAIAPCLASRPIQEIFPTQLAVQKARQQVLQLD